MPRFCTPSTDGSAALVFCLFFGGGPRVQRPPREREEVAPSVKSVPSFKWRFLVVLRRRIPPPSRVRERGRGRIFSARSRGISWKSAAVGWLFNATAWKGPKITGPFWFNETIDLTAFVSSLGRNVITCIWARILILCEEAGKRNILWLRILLVQGYNRVCITVSSAFTLTRSKKKKKTWTIIRTRIFKQCSIWNFIE